MAALPQLGCDLRSGTVAGVPMTLYAGNNGGRAQVAEIPDDIE